MPDKLVFACNIGGGYHRMDVAKCDHKHVNVCNKNGRLCNGTFDLPSHCKIVGQKADNCVFERVTT